MASQKKLAILHNLEMKLDGQPTVNIIEDNQVVDMKSLIIDVFFFRQL